MAGKESRALQCSFCGTLQCVDRIRLSRTHALRPVPPFWTRPTHPAVLIRDARRQDRSTGRRQSRPQPRGSTTAALWGERWQTLFLSRSWCLVRRDRIYGRDGRGQLLWYMLEGYCIQMAVACRKLLTACTHGGA